MLQAMQKVRQNKGSAGIDSMYVSELSELNSRDKTELTNKVSTGRYLPQAIKGVEIPKSKPFAFEYSAS